MNRPAYRTWLAIFATFAVLAPNASAEDVPTRDQIADAYKWDLTTMYPNIAAWEADFERAEGLVKAIAGQQDVGFQVPATLLATLELREDTRWLVDKLVVYSHQLSDEDTRNNTALALKNRATALHVAFSEATAWIEPTLLEVPTATLRQWYRENDQLGIYAHYLENLIRQKPHTLSPREEELLAMTGGLGSSPSDTFNVLANGELQWKTTLDEDGREVPLSFARYSKFIRSPQRNVRQAAFEGFTGTLDQYRNTFAATLGGAIQGNILHARARGFDTPLASTMFPDNLPVAVYDNLVATINRNLPLLHRWAALRKEVTGVDKLHMYDLYQPLITGEQQDIDYDESVRWILEALEPLGPEYMRVANHGFSSRWIDVYETQGKRAGGYSWGSYDTQPYILINYNGTLRDVSVTAHEIGHSIHSYLTHENQPKIYGDYSGFVAEVAAIFNEILLEHYLLERAETTDDKLRLLNEQIDNLRGTVFRQVMFAEFEYAANDTALRGAAITADGLCKLYLDTFHKYWGPQLERDEIHGIYWACIPHFYMNHYVYRYATSYCAAVALAEKVIAGEPGAREAYLTFLKAGSSDYPIDVLKTAGVDMTTPAPVDATMRRFEKLVNEFERLLPQARAAR